MHVGLVMEFCVLFCGSSVFSLIGEKFPGGMYSANTGDAEARRRAGGIGFAREAGIAQATPGLRRRIEGTRA